MSIHIDYIMIYSGTHEIDSTESHEPAILANQSSQLTEYLSWVSICTPH